MLACLQTHINIIALDHGAEADPVANTVARLVGVNDVAVVVDLDLVAVRRLAAAVAPLLVAAAVVRIRPALLPGRCLPLAHGGATA